MFQVSGFTFQLAKTNAHGTMEQQRTTPFPET
jgi:hypothetical protein